MRRASSWLLTILAAAALVVMAGWTRHPAIVARLPRPEIAFAAVDLAIIALTFVLAKRADTKRLLLAALVGVLLVTANARLAWASYRADTQRREVLAEPQAELHAVARHVLAGFYDWDEARVFARAGVAGLFLSPRNVRGRTPEQIAGEVAALQALRRELGLPPLRIAADQEGGIVANLSPPLPRPAAIASLAKDRDALAAAAQANARDLVGLGVDVDFAPVVDVSRGRVDPADRNSRIALRSISSDPTEIAAVADLYCRTLAAAHVQCTIKHFPGLGPVTADTHVAGASLRSIADVDLAPFRSLTRPDGPKPWVMLGHVTIEALDPARPSSASPAIIALLRRQLGYDGVLITDDASMVAYHAALPANVVSTLKGGGDLVLASYDPDVAFEVLANLVAGARDDPRLRQALAESDRRLAGKGQTPSR